MATAYTVIPTYINQYRNWRQKAKARKILESLFEECFGICPSCKIHMKIQKMLLPDSATLDHIIPLKTLQQHVTEKEYFQVLCHLCNQAKGSYYTELGINYQEQKTYDFLVRYYEGKENPTKLASPSGSGNIPL